MLLKFSETAQIKPEEQEDAKNALSSYLSHLHKVSGVEGYAYDESSIYLPFDESFLKDVIGAGERSGLKRIKELVLIGIGGSSLGVKALLSATGVQNKIKIHFMETFEKSLPELNANPEEVLVNFISKSGTTFESVINLRNLLTKYPQLKNRVVVTTSYNDRISSLRVDPLAVLNIPEKVGGRFSVFSPVGLFPLLAAGLNIFDVMEGAMGAVRSGTSSDVLKNPALFSSVVKFINYQKGRSINVSFYFHSQLEDLGKWWRQLTAESLGKQGKGLTPVVSIGTQDLHSMLQLYLEGPKDKFTEFVYAENETLPEVKVILDGVKKSYQDQLHPFIELNIQALSEKAVAYYMQTKMLETMLLAHLMKINAFDQPAVEGYKGYVNESIRITDNL